MHLHNIDKFKQAIELILEQKRATPKFELEWRLGRMNLGAFSPNVDASPLLNKYTFEQSKYSVVLYPNGVRVRDGRAEHKRRVDKLDLDYLPIHLRLSLSDETDARTPDEIPTSTREIERWTAQLNGAELMISRVSAAWEVEIEFTEAPATAEAALAPIIEVLGHLLQDRPNMVAAADIQRVAKSYNEFWTDCAPAGFLRRVGRKPLNFIASDVELLLTHEYAVSNKLDGTKYTLIINDGAYAVSEVDAIYLGETKYKTDAFFDGEWCDNKLYLFDVQMRTADTYTARIDLMTAAAEAIAIDAIVCKTVNTAKPLSATQATLRGMKREFKAHWQERNDGIIYTPVNVPYLASNDRVDRTLKWKFPDKISIDVRLRRDADAYRGYADGRTGEVRCDIVVEGDDDSLDGVIAEIGLQDDKFYVMRTRPDKTRPNYITVVEETLKDMREPFTLKQLLAALKRKRGGAADLIAIPDDAVFIEATNYIETDRARFDKILQRIAQFVVDNKLIISNPESIVDGAIPSAINMYAQDGLRTANDLANVLYAASPTIFMKTVIPYEEFEISALSRVVARVYAYPRVRHINTAALFRSVPTIIDGVKVQALSREIELIKIYHALYRPFPDKWPEAREIESTLWRDQVVAGAVARPKPDFVREVRKALFAAMEFNDLGVLIGHWAHYELSARRDEPTYDKLQILSEMEPEAARERLELILRDVTPVKLTWKTDELYIPQDMHLRRTTYYFEWKGAKIPLADMFNSLTYEIVPVVTGKIKKLRIGNPYVLQRFFLIDLWTLGVLALGKYITRDVAEQKSAKIMAQVKRLREPEWTALCGRDEYVGVYKDLAIERRRRLKQEEKFRPYKPLEYFEQYGKLRVMKNI